MGRTLTSSKTLSKTRTSFRRPGSRHFVSFSGNKSPKTSRSPLSSMNSINRKRWNAFYLNGRAMFGDRIFRKSCTLFCSAVFSSEKPITFWERSSSTVMEPHANIKAIFKIADMEQTHGEVRTVDFLSSYSPCARCATAIIDFVQASPLLEITIAFSAIYQQDEVTHRQGLKRLNSQPGVTLRVFNENDWWRLAKETDVPLHYSNKRKVEDRYWDYIFQMILADADKPVSLEGFSPIHPSCRVPPSGASQPSLEIHSKHPFLPFQTFNTFDPSRSVQPPGTSQPFQSERPRCPPLPSSTTQPIRPIYSRRPVFPSSASQLFQPTHPRLPVLSSTASQPFQPVLPSSITQPFQPIPPSSITQPFQPVGTLRPTLPPSASQQYRPIHSEQALPHYRTFRSSSPIIHNSSTSLLSICCPTESVNPNQRTVLRIILFIVFMFIVGLLAVILVIVL